MNISEKAEEVLRLTKEIIEECKHLKNEQISGLFRTFEDDFICKAEVLVEWTKDI